ncbi:MAG: thiol peroxidase [Marinilabiliaceae bacterium]|nr:thiol peroxidase [Marinilabiliaceae bacterium]
MNKVDVKVTFKGNPVTIIGNKLKVGMHAPEFTLSGADLSDVKLSDFKGNNVVIAIYPSIDTGVCAIQNKQFNKIATSLKETVVLSVSLDLPFAQGRFCAAEGLTNIVTLSDYKNREFGEKYGFLIDELKLLTRGTVIIDKTGVIKYIEYVPEITTEPDYNKAIEVLKSI